MWRESSLEDIGTALLDIAMPRLCVVCGHELLLRERHICTDCLAQLPLTRFWNQSRNPMADKLNALIQNDLGEDGYEPYANTCALFYYGTESPYAHITPQLKYYHNIKMGQFFSAMLGRRLCSSPEFEDVDMVIPVPLHPLRRWKRGYNQAEIIASEIVRVYALRAGGREPEMRTDILRRVRNTRTQTALSGESKVGNMESAFALRHRFKESVPRHILLVDDVFTSGSTLFACRRVLRQHFGSDVKISVATLAFVGN